MIYRLERQISVMVKIDIAEYILLLIFVDHRYAQGSHSVLARRLGSAYVLYSLHCRSRCLIDLHTMSVAARIVTFSDVYTILPPVYGSSERHDTLDLCL